MKYSSDNDGVPAAWTWRQRWHDLLFAHWPVPVSAVRPLVPDWLTIEEHSGSSWVGVVPFRMTGVTWRGVPALPWLSRFAELNVRLYVAHDGKPGVWFLSLDAARLPAVWAARRFAHLSYHWARMRVEAAGEDFVYRSARVADPRVTLDARYGPSGPVSLAPPGSLAHFLTERYCLYTARGGERYRLDIQHQPWPLQSAHATFTANTMAEAQGLALPDVAPLLHFSRRIDVVGGGLRPCAPVAARS